MADVKLVRMTRDPETNPPPFACDCHPGEVENYRAGGWIVADADPLDHDGDGKKGGSKRKAKAEPTGDEA